MQVALPSLTQHSLDHIRAHLSHDSSSASPTDDWLARSLKAGGLVCQQPSLRPVQPVARREATTSELSPECVPEPLREQPSPMLLDGGDALLSASAIQACIGDYAWNQPFD
eukprot:CAMPEP_0115840128 /NCGR_PEP_ID=MMETSP0287-20121206/6611_1 /TAXON_ID=412157 /ORGANISM="Chrysochromulina rotalis, Strain UIO044" /LENGTH=110 /DNA_ID=CAMNT_0003293729 /DNA_START=93 /DNA_END=425 /DNA_ORIENTATION=-